MFFYCESEQGSSCSTPFVSAPSSPTRTHSTSAPSSSSASSSAPKSNTLYYYFSAPSSPPKQPMSGSHHRGFSFTECEFQFHSRFISDPPAAESSSPKEQQEMEDAQLTGFYFSAPTSPDRNKERSKGAGMSVWDEMPGTPKIIFGGGSGYGANPAAPGGFFNADSDFEFSSSRMSDSDSTISAHMSSADELFFKGQLLPMKLRDHQLTSSDSSGSSNTMGGASTSSVAGSAPQSPRFGRKVGDVSPSRVKSAVMGTICGAVMKSSEEEDKSSGGNTRTRSLSPLQLLRKYQSMMMMMGRPSSSSSSSSSLGSSSVKSKSSHAPRPARSSSKGRTLRELLHLSSVHKKSKAEAAAPAPAPAPAPDQEVSKPASSDSDATTSRLTEASIPSKSVDTASSSGKKTIHQQQPEQQQQQQTESRKKYVERSLLGDYTKKFNKHQQQQATRRRYHSGSILDLHYGYYNSKHRLHSGSIVPESDYPPPAPPPHHHLMNKFSSDKRLNYHVVPPDHNGPSRSARAPLGSNGFHSGPLGGGEFNHGSLGGSSHSNRFANVAAVATTLDYHHHSRRWESGVYSYYNNSNSNSLGSNGISSASSSRNVSPRRGRHSSGGCGGGGSGSVSLHELHYKSQRGNNEELRRKTFLPYKQGLLGCLGCATMRIAGLSKSLQPMASSR